VLEVADELDKRSLSPWRITTGSCEGRNVGKVTAAKAEFA
jgi:hypothetical protein